MTARIVHPRRAKTRTVQAVSICLALILSLTTASEVRAQGAQKKKTPPPEDIELKDANGIPLTRDVLIKATFYPGTKGKDSVPIILVHGYKGSRADFAPLAEFLQTQHGHAVLVPDLRGHGESTEVLLGNSKKPLEYDRLNTDHWEAMVKFDLEACKKFLMAKNNAGELNIEKLCLVAADMGAVVAMNWAVWDWHWPVLATGKQGQDVKCLILLSPDWKVEKGALNMGTAVNEPVQSQLATYIIYGNTKGGSSAADAKRVHRSLERFHTENDDSLLIYDLNTTLQGTKLLTVPELKMEEAIATIIEKRVASKTMQWRDRSGPLK